jgi:hypothetical protein
VLHWWSSSSLVVSRVRSGMPVIELMHVVAYPALAVLLLAFVSKP